MRLACSRGASCKHAPAGGSFITLDTTHPVSETRGNKESYSSTGILRNKVWIIGPSIS